MAEERTFADFLEAVGPAIALTLRVAADWLDGGLEQLVEPEPEEPMYSIDPATGEVKPRGS